MKGLESVLFFNIAVAATIAVIGFAVLLVLKLTGVVGWSWAAVTAPLWGFILAAVVMWLAANFLLWEATRESRKDSK